MPSLGKSKLFYIMANINVTVKSVQVVEFVTEEQKKLPLEQQRKSYSVKLTFNESFEGFVENSNKEFIKTNVDYISLPKRVFLAKLFDLVEDLDIVHSYLKEKNDVGLGELQLKLLLRNATLDMEREFHEKGKDTYTTKSGEEVVYDNDGYTTDFLKIELSKKGQENFEKMMDNAMDAAF